MRGLSKLLAFVDYIKYFLFPLLSQYHAGNKFESKLQNSEDFWMLAQVSQLAFSV